ncbi:hypothetical protein [Alkalihalobacillus sp. CinArs1]|uniref:hypothetical protein n=1 Tax=Alkalihalobacillus sp. CinArs1 TaxID=2995314 RepID=UPI0022DD0352|nr:hypothetical protein [Alkalihalobacillus sp. CinArs1]
MAKRPNKENKQQRQAQNNPAQAQNQDAEFANEFAADQKAAERARQANQREKRDQQ